MPTWAQILLRLFAGQLVAQGRTEQAGVLTDALKAVESGRNVDAQMQAYAEQWQQNGEPPLEQIVATRQSIQAAID